MTPSLTEVSSHVRIGDIYTNNYDTGQEVIKWEHDMGFLKGRLFELKESRWHLSEWTYKFSEIKQKVLIPPGGEAQMGIKGE